jgi:Raf kinase inhibitor-like YbhB/YbcL family protein
VSAILMACSPASTGAAGEEGTAMSLEMESPTFQEGKPIPSRFTCDGEDISPELGWSSPPAGTRTFALIMDDPDAPVGTWDHWVLYDLPSATRSLPEGVPEGDSIAGGGAHGKNSWGRRDYGGPCPPGGTHRYFFKLYALDVALGLPPGADKKELLGAMKGHILAEGQLMGTYARR